MSVEAFIQALHDAHNTGRNAIRLASVYERDRDYYLREASRHFERARWYIQWIRRGGI
jgi:hypothetical protein